MDIYYKILNIKKSTEYTYYNYSNVKQVFYFNSISVILFIIIYRPTKA